MKKVEGKKRTYMRILIYIFVDVFSLMDSNRKETKVVLKRFFVLTKYDFFKASCSIYKY